MKNVIQITDNILGVIVPENSDNDSFEFNIDRLVFYTGISPNHCGEEIYIGFEFIIHGTCTLPTFEFDFEVDESWVEMPKGLTPASIGWYIDTKNSLFRTRIQKAIQDEGMFVVNPVKLMDGKNISCSEEAEAYHKNMTAFVEAESKTVKKLLLIEKI